MFQQNFHEKDIVNNFYSAIAQEINKIRPKKRYNAEYFRELCRDYLIELDREDKKNNWVRLQFKDSLAYQHYLSDQKNTEKKYGSDILLNIEAVIICNQLNIAIHVIDAQESEQTKQTEVHYGNNHNNFFNESKKKQHKNKINSFSDSQFEEKDSISNDKKIEEEKPLNFFSNQIKFSNIIGLINNETNFTPINNEDVTRSIYNSDKTI